ncbi:MAG: hypothetical protein IPG80_08250 [Anaerolineales bacterium]|jgi:hypothetical protein|uniref:hypothetical protein n=1 Tax=Candidatus Villigracilis vicinus TaxID=3140679 RepID=UPI00313667F0|nr:hypothetical protein [Anaerolineales bacterium]MBK9780583.1 hypothetical protein [Anaerolineales bacterium]
MHTGLLWFDNDPRTTLSVKIQKAMDYYSKKFGRRPDLCLVHPSMMDAGQIHIELGKLVVRAYRPVMPGHFWIGTEDQGKSPVK